MPRIVRNSLFNNALSCVDYSVKNVFPPVRTMEPDMGALSERNRKWTAEGFAAWAARQDAPYEYDGNDPQMMTGAYWPHNRVVRNIADALKPHLVGTAYDVFGPQDLIHTVGEVSRAPDVFVAPRLAGRPRIRFIPGAVVVIEVVSDDRDLDYVTKLIEYEQVGTILRYVIVEQDQVGYAVWSRERGDLHFTPSTGKSSASIGLERVTPIPIPELGAALPLAAVYSDLEMLP
jgi:Uma2 family endonuclease